MRFEIFSFLAGTLTGLGVAAATVGNSDIFNADTQVKKNLNRFAATSIIIGFTTAIYVMTKNTN